jgi:hypothetical protein
MRGWTVLAESKVAARIPEIHHTHITVHSQEHYARRNAAFIGRRLGLRLRIAWSDALDASLPCLADFVESRRAGR